MPVDVLLDRGPAQEQPLGRSPGRVADHARAAADDDDRRAAGALEVDQPEDRDEVPDVERRARSGRSRCSP